MKKKNVINLIKYFTENNASAFRDEAYEIAADFHQHGDVQLGDYILALLSDKNVFIPQTLNNKSDFFRKIEPSFTSLPLPETIAVGYNAGINKFLFSGSPGTGKTESAKHLARILNRELFAVDFDSVIDSKLGQTSKNISALFEEINSLPYPEQAIILFDELDALAMDRTDANDLREMGRATSSVLKGLDSLNDRVVLIATTNLIASFDKALLRRFDRVIDFNRYSQKDLLQIAMNFQAEMLEKFKNPERNTRLFQKIIKLMNPIPYPGDLKNLIKSAIAFSSPTDHADYLRRLFSVVKPNVSGNFKELQDMCFTVREIEILTSISKSTISRELSAKGTK